MRSTQSAFNQDSHRPGTIRLFTTQIRVGKLDLNQSKRRNLDSYKAIADSLSVFARIGRVFLIAAMLAVTGSHWVILQSVAWTTMLADNLRTTSLHEAVARTFDGKHPCPLCTQISKGKQAEKKSEFRIEWKKFEFPWAPTTFVFNAPAHFREARAPEDSADQLTHAPPTPPPRAAFV